MRVDIVPGALFPDYELTDHTGTRRKLSDLQGPDPLILVLSRGSFCPKDRRQAEGLVQLHHEMEVGYCRLVTISTDNLIATNEYRTGVGALDVFVRSGTQGAERPRYRRIHGSDEQSDDPAQYRPGAGAHRIQHLQWLLVLWPANNRRASTRPAVSLEEMPPGLGHHRSRDEIRLGTGRERSLLSLRQELREGVWRAGVSESAMAEHTLHSIAFPVLDADQIT